MITCEKAYINDEKIYCKQTDNFCAHVKKCQMTLKWDQMRSAENCPLRYAEEPKEGKKRNAKK